jgi:hypothetical protein
MEKRDYAYNEIDVLSIDVRLCNLEAVDEQGGINIQFEYDLHREWVEITEGGYVVESGYEYHPINVSLVKIVHEKFGILPIPYFNGSTILNLIKYISDELYNDANGI